MTKAVQDVVGSIDVFGALTRCALLHSVQDLKAPQINMWRRLIRELMLLEFKLSHKAVEATKNLLYEKWRSWWEYNNQMVQKISFGLQEPQESGRVWQVKNREF